MVLGYILTYSYIFVVLVLASLCEKFKLLDQEGRRKLVHILLAFTWIVMLRYLEGTIHLIIIPMSFILLNSFSYICAIKDNGFNIPVLSSMERKGKEETPGTVYYAISLTIMGVISLIFKDMAINCGIGLFCMAFGDGMAGVIGKKSKGIFKKQILKDKSIGGSLACMIFSILGCMIYLIIVKQDIHIGNLFILGIFCTILELPGKGIDNLSVPFGCMLISKLLFI